jgi:Rad3-related DNA helicase
MTASRIIDTSRTLYLTANKPLQNQLMFDFSDCDLKLFNLTGHSSYPCTDKLYDDSGDLTSIECSDRSSCGYWRDVDLSLSRTHVCSNYANWISIAKSGDPDRFGKFDLLILDEAHNLESLLCDQLAIRFSKRSIWEMIEQNTPLHSDSLEIWIDWATRCHYITETFLSDSRRVDKIQSRGESQLTKKLKRLAQNLETISSITDEWVIEPTSTGSLLTPVCAANYAEDYLFRGIEKVIFSSATLTSQDLKYLGLESSQYELIDIESGFDAVRRPFYYWPTQAIDYSTMQIEGCIRQVMNRYDRIIDMREDRKGITHSISYRFADLIAHYSRHEVLTHKSQNAQSVINGFMNSPDPGMLVSPIIHEGLDFADDRARYQFIWKVPTLDSRHPLIAARKKRDKKYVLYRTGKTILQMYGRLPRSTRDWGECFMLDKHWGNWMRDAIPWPRYFRAAWRTVQDAPEPINF